MCKISKAGRTCCSCCDDMDIGKIEFIELLEEMDIQLDTRVRIRLIALIEVPAVGRKPDADLVSSNFLNNRLYSLQGHPCFHSRNWTIWKISYFQMTKKSLSDLMRYGKTAWWEQLTSTVSLQRFSMDPPHLSSRLLVLSFKN